MKNNEKIEFLSKFEKDFTSKIENFNDGLKFKGSSILKMWANLQNKKDILDGVSNIDDFQLLHWEIIENEGGEKDFICLIKEDKRILFKEIKFNNRTPLSYIDLDIHLLENNKIFINDNASDPVHDQILREEEYLKKIERSVYAKNLILYLANRCYSLNTNKNYTQDKFVKSLENIPNISNQSQNKFVKNFVEYLNQKYGMGSFLLAHTKEVLCFESFIEHLQNNNLITSQEIEKNLPNFFAKTPYQFSDSTFHTFSLMLMGVPMMESIFASMQWNQNEKMDLKEGGIRCQALSKYVNDLKNTMAAKNSTINLSDIVNISLKMDNSQLDTDLDFFTKVKKIPTFKFTLNNTTKFNKDSKEISFIKSLTKSGNGDPRKYLNQYSEDKWEEMVAPLKDFFKWVNEIDLHFPDYKIRNYFEEISFSKIMQDNNTWHHTWPMLLSSFLKKDAVSWEGLLKPEAITLINEKLNCQSKELTTKDELDKEGKEQKNCVLTYLGSCAEDIVRIISLNYSNSSDTNSPAKKITIEIVYKKDTIFPIQIKGYNNKKVTEDTIEKIFEILNQDKEKYFNQEVLQKLKENQFKSKRLDREDNALIVHYQQNEEVHILENMFKNILNSVNKLKGESQKQNITPIKEMKI